MWEHLQAWMVFGVKCLISPRGTACLCPFPGVLPCGHHARRDHVSLPQQPGAAGEQALPSGFARAATGFLLPHRLLCNTSVPACSCHCLSLRDREGRRDPLCCSGARCRSSQHLHLAQACACMCFVRLRSLCPFFASPLLLRIPKSYIFDPRHVRARFVYPECSKHLIAVEVQILPP